MSLKNKIQFSFLALLIMVLVIPAIFAPRELVPLQFNSSIQSGDINVTWYYDAARTQVAFTELFTGNNLSGGYGNVILGNTTTNLSTLYGAYYFIRIDLNSGAGVFFERIQSKTGNITGEWIQDNNITSTDIQDRTIASADIAGGVINSSLLAFSSVNASHILFKAINATHIDFGIVNGSHIGFDQLNYSHILNNTIRPQDFNVSASPSNGQFLTYNSTYNILTWVANPDTNSGGNITGGSFTNLIARWANATHLNGSRIILDDLSPSSVNTTQIVDSTITTDDIALDTITAGDIASGAITTDEILDGTILVGDIQIGTLTANRFAPESINLTHIINSTIKPEDLNLSVACSNGQIFSYNSTYGIFTCIADADTNSGGNITGGGAANMLARWGNASHLNLTQVVAQDIIPDAINATHIATDAVGTAEIASGGVASDEILDGSIVAADIQISTITANRLAPEAINYTQIINSTIKPSDINLSKTCNSGEIFSYNATYDIFTCIGDSTGGNITGGGTINQLARWGNATHLNTTFIVSEDIAFKAINSSHIGFGTINSSLLAFSTINASHINFGAINSSLLAFSSVNASHILYAAINSTHIGYDVLNTSHIINSTIRPDDFNISKAPTASQILSWNSTYNIFTWIDDATGGSGGGNITGGGTSGTIAVWGNGTHLSDLSNPSNCAAGQYAQGIDAAGAAEGCTADANSGGNVTGGGTADYIPLWSNATHLGNFLNQTNITRRGKAQAYGSFGASSTAENMGSVTARTLPVHVAGRCNMTGLRYKIATADSVGHMSAAVYWPNGTRITNSRTQTLGSATVQNHLFNETAIIENEIVIATISMNSTTATVAKNAGIGGIWGAVLVSNSFLLPSTLAFNGATESGRIPALVILCEDSDAPY